MTDEVPMKIHPTNKIDRIEDRHDAWRQDGEPSIHPSALCMNRHLPYVASGRDGT